MYEYTFVFAKTTLAANEKVKELAKLGWRVVSTAAHADDVESGLWITLEKKLD